MTLTAIEKAHLENFCIVNNLDTQLIDSKINYWENKNYLISQSVKEEFGDEYDSLEEQNFMVQNDIAELNRIAKEVIESIDVETEKFDSKKMFNRWHDKNYKKWYKNECIRIAWEKKSKNKRKKWVKSEKYGIKVLL